MSNWIPCKDQLPKIGQAIWVSTNKERTRKCVWGDTYTFLHYPKGVRDEHIVAWQPLEEAEKGV